MLTWALSFDGIDDAVDFGKLGVYNGDLTFEAIVIPERSSSHDPILTDYVALANGGTFLSNYNGVNAFFGRGPENIFRRIEGSTLTLSTPYHLMGMVKNGTWYLYLNGVLDGVGDWSESGALGRANTYLGRSINLYFKGAIAMARLWERALSDAEIANNLFKVDIPVDPAMRGYWKLDEGQGNTVIDSGPRGSVGTITGATWVQVEIPDIAPPGEVLLSAYLAGGASLLSSTIRGKGLVAGLSAGAEMSGGSPIRTRGFDAHLSGSASGSARAQLIASLTAPLSGGASLAAGVIRLIVPPGVYDITQDDYYTKSQPAKSGELANVIKVYTNPLLPADIPEEVYRTKDPLTVPTGQTITFTARYNKSPVIEAVASLESPPAGLNMTTVTYYGWGAEVTIQNTSAVDAAVTLVITGKPLVTLGRQLVTKRDELSIRENGLIEFEFPNNPLVQTREMAEKIAAKLLAFSIPRRDVQIEWRGNPALVLADKIQVPEYQRGIIDERGLFYITRQRFEYDGALRVNAEGRKINQ